MNYQILKNEIDTDPLGAGYSGMTDAQVATELNLVNKSYDIPVFSGKQVKEAFEGQAGEWSAIGAEGRSELLSLVARDDLDPHGVDATIFTQAVNPTGSNNLAPNATAALNSARTIIRSRADILGLGTVLETHVNTVRAQ